MKERGLTYKQELFCQAYIECGGNQSEAYRKAYPSSKGWKDYAVNIHASQMMKNDKILVRVRELQAETLAKSDLTKEELLGFVRSALRIDIRAFLKIEDGKLKFKDSDEWTDEMAKLVEGVKTTKDGIEIKLAGKTWSVERACKMLGLDSPEKIEHSGKIEIPQICVRTEGDKDYFTSSK